MLAAYEEYSTHYAHVRMERREGILQLTLHTDGGRWCGVTVLTMSLARRIGPPLLPQALDHQGPTRAGRYE